MAVFYLEVLNVLDRDNAAIVVYDAEWENPHGRWARSSPIARWSRAWSSAAMSGRARIDRVLRLGANFLGTLYLLLLQPGAGLCAGSRCSSSTSWSGSRSRVDVRRRRRRRSVDTIPRSPFTSCRLRASPLDRPPRHGPENDPRNPAPLWLRPHPHDRSDSRRERVVEYGAIAWQIAGWGLGSRFTSVARCLKRSSRAHAGRHESSF